MTGMPVLEPWMLQSGRLPQEQACLVVRLDDWPGDVPLAPRPPVPLVGIGASSHPAATSCDVLVEEPVSLESLLAAIAAMPRPASAICSLLRATEALEIADAMAMESLTFAALQGSEDHLGWRDASPARAPGPPGEVHLSRDDDRLTITLDRPEAHNAIDRHMRDALYEAFEMVALDPSIAQVLLRGEGRFFSMGAELEEFGTTTDPMTAHAIRMRTLPAIPMARRREIVEVHVQGGAVGSGLELAAFAGRITCTPRAWFQLPEMAMGILPGAGGCVSIPRRIGRQRAALMILSGRKIDAQTALSWGLVDEIVG